MSQLLLSDLTALSNESKRRCPEAKSAADAALTALRADFDATLTACRQAGPSSAASGSQGFNRGSSISQSAAALSQEEAKELFEANLLLRPIYFACNAKTHLKVAGLGVALLQRIVAMKVVPEAAIGPILELLTPLLAKGDVDLLLKLLQTFSALLLSYPSIHGPLLSLTLRHCFHLQSSKVQVVSSTAAATVRQAIMIVFEKVVEEDGVLDGIKEGGEDAAAAAPLAAMTAEVPGEESVTLFPSSADAFKVFCDLNALAQDEPASFLEFSSLPRTFTLELIESILTNHTALVRGHPELLHTLRESTCPLLIKALSEKPAFPTALRYTRLLFVLLRQFSTDLVVETEVLLSILLRFVASSQEAVPKWQRIIALEVTRSLCSDGAFLRNLWAWFDGKESSPAKVFTNLVMVLRDVAEESGPAIGANHTASSNSPRPSTSTDRRVSGAFSLYEAAAGVANAMLNTSQDSAVGNLTLSSTPSLQFIDQLEKAEAPNAPPTYVYLLGLQSLVHVTQSLAQHILPAYSSFVNARTSSARVAPPRLEFEALEQRQRRDLLNCKAMVATASKMLRSSLFLLLSARLDDTLFCEVLTAVRNWTNVCGVLDEDDARNAFIAGISSLALPEQLPDDDPNTPEMSLSERNLAALRVLAHVAVYLSGILDSHWRPVLAALCDAELLIKRAKARREGVQGNASQDDDGKAGATSPRSSRSNTAVFQPGFSVASTPADSKTGRPQLLSGLDFDTLLREIAKCFENSTSLNADAFQAFLEGLCELCEASVRQAAANASAPPTLVLSTPVKDRRQSSSAFSGQLQRPLRDGVLSGSVYLLNLDTVLRLNVKRLNDSEEERGWRQAIKALLDLACDHNVRPVLRTQAAEVLAGLLLGSISLEVEEKQAAALQRRVFAPLRTMSILNKDSSTAAVEVRKVGIKTLRKIVEVHGYASRLGWNDIFEAAIAACHRPAEDSSAVRTTLPLVKTAFAATQIVCNDLLAALSLEQLLLIIEALQGFGTAEDINVALTAGSALWSLTGEIADRSSSASSSSSSGPSTSPATAEVLPVWLRLLTAFRAIAADERAEVRDAAVSGLFRILSSYGLSLDSPTWSTAWRTELFPLLDACAEASAPPASATSATAAGGEASSPTTPSRPRRKSSLSRPSQEAAAAEHALQWQKTRALAYEELGGVVGSFLSSRLLAAEDFAELWDTLLAKIKSTFLAGPALVSQASIGALKAILSVDVDSSNDAIRNAWRRAWQTWASMADSVESAPTTFSQANLLAFVETFSELYRCQPESVELEAVPRLQRVSTYGGSKERINDVDQMSPVQAATRKILLELNHQPGLSAALLRTLAERISLPFTLQPSSPAGASQQQQTFIAVHKAAISDVVALYGKHDKEADTYTSGAFDAVLAALAVPIKLRYDCPQPYRNASSSSSSQPTPRPLWQEATLAFATMSAGCCRFLAGANEDSLPGGDVEAIWRHILAIYQAAFDADCSGREEEQQEDAAFDLVLLSTFERHVWPVLGHRRTPAAIVEQFAVSLSRASCYHDGAPATSPSQSAEAHASAGTVPSGSVVAPQTTPRETFASACLDLLFLICSSRVPPGSDNEDKQSKHRVAALSLPVLLGRVKTTLKSYTADAALQGSAPFPRARDEEAYALLSHLLDLRLYPETLAAASSGDATRYLDALYSKAHENGDAAPREEATLRTLAQRSPRAHLFALHGPLVDVASLSASNLIAPRRLPAPSPPQGFEYAGLIGNTNVLDSRRLDREEAKRIPDLARACLDVVSEAFD